MKYLLATLSASLTILVSGCGTNVALPPSPTTNNSTTSVFKIKKYTDNIEYQDINKKKIQMPRAGEENAFGIIVSKEIEIAYDNFLGGDVDKALNSLETASKNTKDNLTLWQISFLKAKILMLLGLDADAGEEIKICSKYEKAHFKHTLNSTALRGEIYLMEGEFDKARADFNYILSSIGDWELPTSYGMPPSNMTELVSITTAQLRAYTGMSASYVMQDRYSEAKIWAEEAEARFNAIHYVSNHGLYGMFIKSHLDSYYGRAMNMVMLGSAILGDTKDYNKSDYYYKQASKFFNAINYEKGEIISLSLKAKALGYIGEYNKANKVGLEAIELANKKKMYDFIWRIETLRGEYLLKENKVDEAQLAFRKASNVIDLVSGDLKTDFSKRRFGTDKGDLAYNLMQIDIQQKDYKQLFIDVENSRARAFVDIMRNRAVSDSNSNLIKEIREIDKKIKKLVIENNSYSLSSSDSLVQEQPSDERKHLLEKLNSIDPDSESMVDVMTREKVLEMIKELDKKDTYTKVSIPKTSNLQEQEQLRQERETLVKNLIKLEPKSASIVSNFSYKLADIQKTLADKSSIVYFLPVKADEKIKALLITKNSVNLKTFELTQTKLSNIMKQYLIKIGAYDNSLTSQMRSFKKKAKAIDGVATPTIDSPLNDLHKLLSLEDIKTSRVYVVGSGATTYIPWGTYDKSIEVSLIPNASWLLNTSKSTNSKGVVIVGNPNYGGELDQLPGTVKEAQALAKLYGIKPLLYKNATIQNVKRDVGDGVKILHLATHGVFYSDKPLDSAIFLSQDSKLYTLSAKEIFKSPIKADLVVLSACETGMGANVAGDDLLGLPRSFFLGGTKAIVSSLWPIDDEGTKEFMTEFHKYAKDGEYEKGLLKAKEHLKAKGFNESVYGAFVLYGTSL